MGIFNCTFLYKGELVREGESPKKYFTEAPIVLYDYKLYCDNYVVLDGFSRVVSSNEIDQGYVKLERILGLIENNSELKKEWGETDDDSDIYICECVWFSMNMSSKEVIPLPIQYHLPCKDPDLDYYINLHNLNKAKKEVHFE